MARYFLIGGKDDDLKSNYLETVLISLTRKVNPKILYFPTAMLDKESSINHFKNTFKDLLVTINTVTLFNSKYSYEELDQLFSTSDIIYFGGGNTNILYNKLKENKVDILLEKYKKSDKIYAGVSAGAIIYTNSGMGDSDAYINGDKTINFKMVKGFSYLNFSICPHYQKNELYIFNDEAKDLKLAYALEDDTAILVDDFVKVFKANCRNSVYEFKNGLMKPLYESYRIHALGPINTYSYVASLKYEEENNLSNAILTHKTIRKTIEAIKDSDLAIIPIENSLDGYVGETLDLLYEYDLEIISDLSLPISFSLVSMSKENDIEKVFVQFKAKGQCLNYLESLARPLIETDSNIESLNLALENKKCGAIVPTHMISSYDFKYVKQNVCDKTNNYTRFIVVRKKKENIRLLGMVKASVLLIPSNDRSGILYEMLKMFNDHNINLNAIMSRPTKEGLGKYYFYVEFSDQIENLGNIIKVLEGKSANKDFKIKCLGIYPKEGEKNYVNDRNN